MTTTIEVWEQWKTKIEVFSMLLAMITTLSGGSYAVIQYIDNSNAERVKETLVFVDKFDKDDFLKSRSKIGSSFKNIETELYEKVSDKDRYLNFLTDKIENYYIENNLERVFDFYDELYICTLNDLCDQKVALEFFGKYAYDIVGVTLPYIEKNKEESHDRSYASGIKFFFQAYKKKSKSNSV
jgi:hypothetical protein